MSNVTKAVCIAPTRETDDGLRCYQRTKSPAGSPETFVMSYSDKVSITSSLDRMAAGNGMRYVADELQQRVEGTQFAYFQPDYNADGTPTGTGQCVQWDPGQNIEMGCAPFESEAACSFACREYDSHKAAEIAEELEEEAVEIGAFLYHFAIMFYMCLALALVCEDFFVASLEIIIDKLKLPPDVAGATFMAAGSSSPELFVATVAVFAVGDAGHRCSLIPADSPYRPGDADFVPEFALPCDTPEDSLGWLTDPDAMTESVTWSTEDNSTLHACAEVKLGGDPDHILGQKIYIDEGVGVGAVVGSTMFNTLCIIGGSAVVSGKISKLDWRIIMRDGTTYMVAIFTLAWVLNMPDMEEHPVLAFFSSDSESCTPMKLTKETIEGITADHWKAAQPDPVLTLSETTEYCGKHIAHATALITPCVSSRTATALLRRKSLLTANFFATEPKVYGTYDDPLARVESGETIVLLTLYGLYIVLCAVFGRIMDKICPAYGSSNSIGFAEMGAATTSFDAQDKTNRPSVDGFEAYKKNRQLQNRRTVVARQLVGAVLRGEATYEELTSSAQPSTDGYTADVSAGLANGTASGTTAKDLMDSSLFDAAVTNIDDVQGDARGSVSSADAHDAAENGDSDAGDSGHHEEHVHNIWAVPTGKAKIFWAVSFPLMVAFTYTIPDPHRGFPCIPSKFKHWYLVTFFMAIAWMGILVEVMVDHAIEAFHENLGIEMGPLGLTFVAAGTSFPDFLASMLVAKKGLADMAVSNAFGSNIFDVLLGLGWPWMMQTTLVDPGAVLYVGSMSFLNDSFKLLIGSYFIWLFVLSCVKWNLAPLMGVIMCGCYLMWAASLFF